MFSLSNLLKDALSVLSFRDPTNETMKQIELLEKIVEIENNLTIKKAVK